MDVHKYGLAPKGTSVVLYRNHEIRKVSYWFCGLPKKSLIYAPILVHLIFNSPNFIGIERDNYKLTTLVKHMEFHLATESSLNCGCGIISPNVYSLERVRHLFCILKKLFSHGTIFLGF